MRFEAMSPYMTLSCMISEAGYYHAAKAMHSHIKGLRDICKGEQRHHTRRTVTARTIRAYRNAWDTLTS